MAGIAFYSPSLFWKKLSTTERKIWSLLPLAACGEKLKILMWMEKQSFISLCLIILWRNWNSSFLSTCWGFPRAQQAEFLFFSLVTLWLSRSCLCNCISGHRWVLTLKMDVLNISFWFFGVVVAEGNSYGRFGEWILVTFLSKNVFGCSDVFC